MVHARLTCGIMYHYVNVEVLVRRGAILRAAVNEKSLKISNLSDFFLGRREMVCVLVVSKSKTAGTRKTEGGESIVWREKASGR